MESQENTQTTSLVNSDACIIQVPQFVVSTKSLVNVFQTVGNLVDEVNVKVNSDGLFVRSMDSSHISLVDVALPKECFSSFDCEEEKIFAINVPEFIKTLNQFDQKAGRTVRISILDSSLVLTQDDKTTSLPLIVAGSYQCPLPKLHFNTLIKMEDDQVRQLIKFLELGE